MSLSNPTPPKQYALGLVVAKSLDDPSYLEDLLAPNVAAISHLHTNGANPLVVAFAMEHGIPHTVHPIAAKGLPASIRAIVEASDFVYVIGTPDSKSADQAAAICEKRVTREEADVAAGTLAKVVFHWKRLEVEPIAVWRDRVCRVSEIMACMSVEDRSTGWAKSVWEALES